MLEITPPATHDPTISQADSRPPPSGELNAAIARRVVQIHRASAGRGPTKAQAFFRHDVVVVVLRDVLTTAERGLAADAGNATVLALRRELHVRMRPKLIAAVEDLTSLNVVAFMSDSDIRRDMSTEVFVLDAPVDPRRIGDSEDRDDIEGIGGETAAGGRTQAVRSRRRAAEIARRSAALAGHSRR